MVEINGESYLIATYAARYIGVSRGQFYSNVKPLVSAHKLPARRRWHYKKSELDVFCSTQLAA